MAVITSDGIVGKVLQVFPSVSQVLLINDPSSGVGTILEKSRLQGFLKGKANGQVTVEGVMSDEQVAQGERVLTSGGDQIFPKGLPVGTVTNVSIGKELFLNINVKPTADLSKLEEVLVLVEKQERQAAAEDNSRIRAADILAQRLPQVPVKPPEANAAAGGTQPKTNGSSEVKAQAATTTGTTTGTQNGAATAKPAGAKSPGVAVVPASTPLSPAAKPKPAISQSKPENAAPAESNAQPPADNTEPH
jgi:rod shape-determining protein MreC